MSLLCHLCGKSFSRRLKLENHLDKKVCQKPQKNICIRCLHHFSSKQMYQYHIEHNVCQHVERPQLKPKIVLKVQCQKPTVDELLMELSETKEKLSETKGKLSEMIGKYDSLKENPQTINNTQQINLIVPPAFLTVDNYEHLSRQLPNLLHEALSQHPSNCISYLIKETNCNPTQPMFNSIKVTNKRDDFVQISDGMKFIYAPRKKTIMDLIENKRHLLQEYVDNNGDKYGEKILRRYQTYVDLLDDEGKSTQKELEIDIVCMLLNLSDVIGSDEWSKKLLDDLKVNHPDDE